MISFIKDYSMGNIKSKFILLYILNVTDIVFTFLLLNSGCFVEANLIMKNAVQSPVAGFSLKAVLPAILLITVYFRMRRATDQQLKKSNILINGAVTFYALVNISHLVWFSMLFANIIL